MDQPSYAGSSGEDDDQKNVISARKVHIEAFFRWAQSAGYGPERWRQGSALPRQISGPSLRALLYRRLLQCMLSDRH